MAVRVSIVLALPPMPTKESLPIISSILKDPRSPAALLQAAIEIAGKNPRSDWDQEILGIAQTTHDDGILGEALEIIGRKKMRAAVPMITSGTSPVLTRASATRRLPR